MRRFLVPAAMLILVACLTACGSSSSGAKVRLVNAMPDETSLDLLVDTKSAATGVGYGAASQYVGIATGSRQIDIEATGASTILINRTDNIAAGNVLTLVSLNFSFDPGSMLLLDDNSAPASGNFKLRIVNASPGMGTQDVYIVPDGTDITSVEPTFPGMNFGDVSSYQSLAAGDYHVIYAVPGQKFIDLDSGKLTFAAGQVRTELGLNNTVGGFQSSLLTDVN